MASILKRMVIEKLQEGDEKPLNCELGSPAPHFESDALMPDGTVKKIKLADYKGKWVILMFYPLDFSFVCGSEICAFSDKLAELDEAQATCLFCSVDSVFSHRAWSKQPRTAGGVSGLHFPVLSDVSREVSTSYGVLYESGEHKGLCMRGTFLIDPKGNLRHLDLNELPIGRSADEMLRLVHAYKLHDANGDVVPSDWMPGHNTVHGPATESATSSVGAFFRSVMAPLSGSVVGAPGTQSHNLINVTEVPQPQPGSFHHGQTMLDAPHNYGDVSNIGPQATPAARAAAASRYASVLENSAPLAGALPKVQEEALEQKLPASLSHDRKVLDEIDRHTHHA